MRTSGKTNNTPGWPNLHRTGPGRDKHIKRGKIEQRKVRGPEWGPQVKQTTLLAGPVYIGPAQGETNI